MPLWLWIYSSFHPYKWEHFTDIVAWLPHYPCRGGGAVMLLQGSKLRCPHHWGPLQAGQELGWAQGRASVVWVLAFGAMVAFYRRKGRLYCHRGALFTAGFLGQPAVVKHGDLKSPCVQEQLACSPGWAGASPVLKVLFDRCPRMCSVSFSWEEFGPASLWVRSWEPVNPVTGEGGACSRPHSFIFSRLCAEPVWACV